MALALMDGKGHLLNLLDSPGDLFCETLILWHSSRTLIAFAQHHTPHSLQGTSNHENKSRESLLQLVNF